MLDRNQSPRKDKSQLLISDIIRREKEEMPESLDLNLPKNQEEFDKLRNNCTKFVSKQRKRSHH